MACVQVQIVDRCCDSQIKDDCSGLLSRQTTCCSVFDFDALDELEENVRDLDTHDDGAGALDIDDGLDQMQCGDCSSNIPNEAPVKPYPGSPTRRIAFVGVGSRGDATPMAAMALRLETLGHTLRLFVSSNLTGFLKERSLDARAAFPDTKSVMERCGGMAGNFQEGQLATRKASQAWMDENPNACVNLLKELATFAPQAILYLSPCTFTSIHLEDVLKVPVIPVCFAPAGLEACVEIPKTDRPWFLAMSQHLASPDFSVPRGVIQTGPWILQEPVMAAELTKGGSLLDLQRFINSGQPPVAIGWGSMLAKGCSPLDMLRLALRALRLAGRRGIVIGGWANLDVLGQELINGTPASKLLDLREYARENVYFVSEVPHSWLLPQCTCMVHHGGAGTSHAALLAGVPAVVTPIFGDQFDFGREIQRQHVGVAFGVPLRRVSATRLAEALHAAEGCTAAARALAEQMRQEDGLGVAISTLQEFLSTLERQDGVKRTSKSKVSAIMGQ